MSLTSDYASDLARGALELVMKRGSLREALPDAWYYHVMRLNPDIHIPAAAQEEFCFLQSEMRRTLEVTSPRSLYQSSTKSVAPGARGVTAGNLAREAWELRPRQPLRP